jgi:hypothetical protein
MKYLFRLRTLLQFANFLLVVAADLLLLRDGRSVHQLVADLLILRNANFVVDDTRSVVTLSVVGALAVVLVIVVVASVSANGISGS